MSEKASYFKLGVFVLVTTALALAGVAVLGAGVLFRHTIVAETYLEESVQGLDVGAPVRHRGVVIGRVSRIAFVGEDYRLQPVIDGKANLLASYVLVEMELQTSRRGTDRTESTFASAVNAGLHARMASSGIVGNVYLDLYFAPDAGPGPELTWAPRSLYIPGTRSVIAELTSTVSAIADQLENAHLDVVAQDIGTLVKTFNQKVDQIDIARIQQDALAFIQEARDSNRRVQEILGAPAIQNTLDNLSKTSESLARISGGGEGDILAFLKDLPSISARLKTSSEEIEKLLKDERTTKMLDNLAQTSELAPDAVAEIRRTAQRLDTLLRSQESDIQTIVRQLAKAAENIQRLSDEAAANPSRLLFGDPPPRSPSTPEKKR